MHVGRFAKRGLRITLAALAFIAFGIGGALLSWLVLPLLSCDWQRARRRRRCQRMVQRSFILFHDYMRLCGLVAYDPRLAPSLPADGPLVLASNHPTLIDVSALIAAYGEVCVVVKGALFRNPLLGPLVRLCGHVDGRGSDDVLSEIVARLRDGHRVLMFPEGTRSPLSGLRRFHLGAFQAAREAGVPLIPVVVRAEPPGLKKHQAWYAIPTRSMELSVRPLDPLCSGAYASARELMFETRVRVEAVLATAPEGA